MFRVVLCALFVANAYQMREGGAAVQKVIQLMQDMLAKGKAAKMDEEVKFAAYKQFCEGTSEEKKTNIADAASEIEDLQASIQKAESDAAVLAEDIVRSEVNTELNFPPNFEGLVLGCIDADFCK